MQRFFPKRIEKIEKPNRVWASVRAIACTDAAVVNLGVQAFSIVVTRIGGAHWLAGRGIALLAEHRDELDAGVRELAFPVTLDANPMDGATTRSFHRPRGGNII